MKTISLDQLKDRHIGPAGSEARDAYETDLRAEVLGHTIKTVRKQRKLTQSQLGELVGVQKAQISKLENNANNVTVETIQKVFRAMNAEVSFTVRLGT